MEKNNVFYLIAAVGTGCSILFAYLGYIRGISKESVIVGKEDGALKSDTEYIRRRVDDLLLELRNVNNKLDSHAERITRVEESLKSAHHRLDEMKG